MRFNDRDQAGRALAEKVLAALGPEPGQILVLALPRGGVPVATQVAAALSSPLEVLVAHKIGAPGNPEFAVGALAEDGPPVWLPDGPRRLGLVEEDLAAAVTATREELRRRVAVYRGDRPLPPLAGARCVVVDDGLATGLTALAAVRFLRERGAARVVVAVPVAPPDTVSALRAEAEVIAVHTPPFFRAVGTWYRDFRQVTDDEVIEALARGGTMRN